LSAAKNELFQEGQTTNRPINKIKIILHKLKSDTADKTTLIRKKMHIKMWNFDVNFWKKFFTSIPPDPRTGKGLRRPFPDRLHPLGAPHLPRLAQDIWSLHLTS